MKLVNLKDNLFRKGEYLIGFEETGTHACYMLYGTLNYNEERELSPGKDHIEIVCLIEGEVTGYINGQRLNFEKGKGFVLNGEEKLKIKNNGNKTAVYVIAGGHTYPSHH